jgi:oligoendopeptidase F
LNGQEELTLRLFGRLGDACMSRTILTLDYSRLPHEFTRKFLPPKLDLTDWQAIGRYYDELQTRALKGKDDLMRWLEDEAELQSAIFQDRAVRYIRMSAHTDTSTYEKKYLAFLEKIEPKVKIRSFDLDEKYLSCPARKKLPRRLYFVMNRKRENNVRLFRKQNVQLEKKEARLAQRYQKIAGAMTIQYEGRERTLQQMASYLEQPDRAVRERVWLLIERRRQRDKVVLNSLFDDLIQLRHRIAEQAGFENYRDYAFKKLGRFDYAPRDSVGFQHAVESYFVPFLRSIDEEQRGKLDVKPLRPWDLIVDPEGRPPLRPYKGVDDLIRRTTRVFEEVDPLFSQQFRMMVGLDLLDLQNRPGKAPGAYSIDLPEARLPFIFLNAVGRDGDVRTLLHESGHSFHTFATRRLPFDYRGENVPAEIAEVASMTMEMIGGEHLKGAFYNCEDTQRSKRIHLIAIVRLLAWIATIDAFQHWVYTHIGHSHAEREECWIRLRERFGGLESWNGYETFKKSAWQRQVHLYELPFYYVEYGIAQFGALGIWTRYLRDPRGAVAAYKEALALGGSRPLPVLFRMAGVSWDFGPNTARKYAKDLGRALIS